MPERVYSLIFEQDDITWQSLLSELVKEEGMNPWDIDIGVLSDRYREMVSELQGFDVRISAKVVLAAALLLRLKSNHLLDNEVMGLDQLIASTEDQLEQFDSFYDQLEEEYLSGALETEASLPKIVPKTPQPRKRKVSLDDLMSALRKALEVKERRVLREMRQPTGIPALKKTRDITNVIKDIYTKIISFVKKENRPMTFEELIPTEGSKSDKISTFIPLLHLATHTKNAPGRIELKQKKHFDTIRITAVKA